MKGFVLNEWALFKAATPAAGGFADLTLALREEHYPFWSQGYRDTVKEVRLIAQTGEDVKVRQGAQEDDLTGQEMAGLRSGKLEHIPLPASPVGPFVLAINSQTINNLWIAVAWGKL